MAYLSCAAFLLLVGGPAPDLMLGFAQITTLSVVLYAPKPRVLLFLFYGRSQVTASVLSFHVVGERT